MEQQQQPQTPQTHHHSNVDTSRPFRSVKEAVAIFGERLLAGDLHARPIALHNKREPSPSWPSLSPSPSDYNKAESKASVETTETALDYVSLESTVKKLEAELEETKEEVKMLKERESETGMALATLNSELHKSLAATDSSAAARSGLREEERMREIVMTRVEGLPTLAEILTSINVGRGQRDNKSSHNKYSGYGFGENKERVVMVTKKKPIVPLVGDLFFSWKKNKGSSTSLHNPLYSS